MLVDWVLATMLAMLKTRLPAALLPLADVLQLLHFAA